MADTHRRTVLACTALLCATGLVCTAGTARAAASDPAAGRSLETVRAEVDALYRRAGAATDAYDAAEEKVAEQQRQLVRTARAIVAAERQVKALRGRIGSFARAQYRGGGMPAELQLMLSADPDEYLSRAPLVRQGTRAAAFTLAGLRSAERELDAYGQEAADRLRELMAAKADKAGARKEIERRLAQAEGLLSALEAKQRARLERLEEAAAYRSQERWLHSGGAARLGRTGTGTGTGTATAAGRAAVGYALAQIGRPYRWGAEGPRAFDCSGLTSQAWAAAGRAIPRTSQEQWARLPHVPVAAMRPGDLVVYFGDASHVGIYVGDGAIVHAPRPGRTVTPAGAGSMPILGVVRPDA